MTFTNDELLLVLVSLVRATRPAMLRQDADGFSIDFEAIAAAKSPRDSDRLLLKLGAAMQGGPAESSDAGSESAAAGASALSAAEPPHGGRSARTEEEGSGKQSAGPDGAAVDGAVSLDIAPAEARQIAGALAKLEQLQAWPADVQTMSRNLRARLTSASTGEH